MTKRGKLKRDLDPRMEPAKIEPRKRALTPPESGYMPAPSRKDKVIYSIHVDPALRHAMKELALKRGLSIQALTEEALRLVYFKYERKALPGQALPSLEGLCE